MEVDVKLKPKYAQLILETNQLVLLLLETEQLVQEEELVHKNHVLKYQLLLNNLIAFHICQHVDIMDQYVLIHKAHVQVILLLVLFVKQ